VDERPDGGPTQPAPFDEGTVLKELEHVRQEIVRYQAVRQEVIDEFDRFLKSFKHPEPSAAAAIPPPPAPIELPRTVIPIATPNAQPVAQPIVQPVARTTPTATAAASTREEALDEVDVLPQSVPAAAVAAAPPPRYSQTTTWLVAGSVLAIVSVGGYALTTRGGRSETSNSPESTPTKAPPPATEAPAAAPTSPAAPALSAFDSVLVTTEPVWVRVIADGEKTLERELAADVRIPIKAEKTIQIRTGNAGAVKLIMGGVDRGPVGREGEVITRTFTVSR
jgi:cytoskeleton protein RodZ